MLNFILYLKNIVFVNFYFITTFLIRFKQMFGVPLEKRDIGIYKVDTKGMVGRWEVCPGPFPVPSVFHGHHHQT